MRNLSFTAKLLLFLAGFVLLVAGYQYKDKVFGQTNITEGKDLYLIGSSASGIALSTSFTGPGSASGTTEGTNFRHQTFFVTYTPKSYGSAIRLLLEGSPDKTCTNYYPFTVQSETAGGTYIYTSSTGGIPYVYPASETFASGTTYRVAITSDRTARCFRISAREITTSTAGELKVHTFMTSE